MRSVCIMINNYQIDFSNNTLQDLIESFYISTNPDYSNMTNKEVNMKQYWYRDLCSQQRFLYNIDLYLDKYKDTNTQIYNDIYQLRDEVLKRIS